MAHHVSKGTFALELVHIRCSSCFLSTWHMLHMSPFAFRRLRVVEQRVCSLEGRQPAPENPPRAKLRVHIYVCLRFLTRVWKDLRGPASEESASRLDMWGYSTWSSAMNSTLSCSGQRHFDMANHAVFKQLGGSRASCSESRICTNIMFMLLIFLDNYRCPVFGEWPAHLNWTCLLLGLSLTLFF